MTETVEYRTVREVDGVEVRRYPPIVLATVEGQYDDSAFSVLFGYISGQNRPRQKLAMTAPVVTQRDAGEAIPMTAPVLSDRGSFSFVLPSGYTVDSAPEPLDPRVRIVGLPARVVAAVRFGGRAYHREVVERERQLLDVLRKNGMTVRGRPFLMRYNSPFTPGFLRRNEVGVEVEEQGSP